MSECPIQNTEDQKEPELPKRNLVSVMYQLMEVYRPEAERKVEQWKKKDEDIGLEK